MTVTHPMDDESECEWIRKARRDHGIVELNVTPIHAVKICRELQTFQMTKSMEEVQDYHSLYGAGKATIWGVVVKWPVNNASRAEMLKRSTIDYARSVADSL